MLIVLIILTILAVILCVANVDYYDNLLCVVAGVGAVVLGIIDLIVIVFIITIFTNGKVAPPKIKMYQEENTKIEMQIDELVKNYMEYEGKTLKDFKGESSIALVSLYPNLKSDELVKKQINIYVENNKKIKELKESEIEMKIGKWLLYFGG